MEERQERETIFRGLLVEIFMHFNRESKQGRMGVYHGGR